MTNGRRIKTACAGVIALGVCGAALATPDAVMVNVSGRFIALPCEVSLETKNLKVDLTPGNTFHRSWLRDAGSAGPWVNFSLYLINCPKGTRQATLTISGTPENQGDEALFKNSGTAQRVSIQLNGLNGEKYGNGQSHTMTLMDETYNWPLRARLFSVLGGATGGTVQTAVTMTFTYH